ncbi:MAG: ShlB/FhaC/HecB family hemolysin secretion/activation protein [Gallionella sp.]
MKCDHKQLKVLTPILAILLLANSLPARAAVPVAPGAGSILQQINPVEPAAPSSAAPQMKIEQGSVSALPSSAPFPVKTIRIKGNTIFDTATLHALVMDAEGKSLTLAQLNELAARITDYYRRHGYPLARAIIPAQTIRDGQVMIEVIEARYGRIDLDNHSRVNDALLASTLSPVQGGQVIDQATLDHSLLLLMDIPGVVPGATLKPGERVGTSDLLVETTSGPTVSGNATLDNYGNSYTGRVRAGATANYLNPLHHGDILSASGLSSGSGMNYGSVSYETLLNGKGTRMGGSYSELHYTLGDTFESLNAHGTAQVESLWAKHPLVRSRYVNLYGQIQYDRKQLRDHIDLINIRTDRHLDNWTASLSGDLRDAFLSGGVNTWNTSWTSGRVGFDDTAAQQSDALTAKTQGGFSKGTANLVRLQNLGRNNSLYLAYSGQWASANLDASEKMVAGGPYTVRAYDMNVVSGDSGYLGTAELRHDLGRIIQGQCRAVGFIDAEHVTINRNPWVAGTNDATLGGAGLGLDCIWPGQWSARTYIAAPVGSTPELLANVSSARAWIGIGKGF